jgi:uroporphyrinogen decarboxylase
MRRTGFDSVPIDFQLCPAQQEAFRRQTGATDPYRHFAVPIRWQHCPLAAPEADRSVWFDPDELSPGTWFDDYGVGHSPGGEGSFHFTKMRHPLKGAQRSTADLAAYPLPLVAADAQARLQSTVNALHAEGLAAGGWLACTIWETSWYLRSMEDLMDDMLNTPERAAAILDRVTALAVQQARLHATTDCDVLELGDDIGMQSAPLMSLDLWREWLKPRLAAVIAAARAVKPDILVYYHSCGFILPFIDDLISIGVDILNPVQPESMSFAAVHARYGDRLSFWGTIGTQTTLPFGTPAEVRNAVRSNLERCGAKGGLVIGPTHTLEPEVPWENFMAMIEAAREFRP